MGKDSAGTTIRFDNRTIEEFAASLRLSPRSVVSYKRCLAYFFSYLEETGAVRPESGDIAAYREALSASGKRAATVHNYLAAVKSFFRWAAAEGLYRDIAGKVSHPSVDHAPRRKTLTGAQMKRVLESIDRGDVRGKRDYALLALMVTGGLDTLEAARATAGDLKRSRTGPVLHIRGVRGGVVRIPPRTWRALVDYLEARGPVNEEAPLFAGLSNRTLGRETHMSTSSISRIVKEAFRGAGYDDVNLTAQSLRFTGVKLALQGGERLEDVQRFARHKTIRTTFLYEQAEPAAQEHGEAMKEGQG
ncbi:MAG: site-specific integrase [Fretibacterium sp.]|nr:site-specific integrase [Fretibacterium sp.]